MLTHSVTSSTIKICLLVSIDYNPCECDSEDRDKMQLGPHARERNQITFVLFRTKGTDSIKFKKMLQLFVSIKTPPNLNMTIHVTSSRNSEKAPFSMIRNSKSTSIKSPNTAKTQKKKKKSKPTKSELLN